ncbi:putative protein TPRXL [Gigantopelta aegis]|uniref:putative protein TPRXL n=1 Tax=Gigantopelta aegis TaxID=1735272 RepID=UPI001B889B64|nr:putative protein TPRXL [Gigantopelta aegis]
MGDTKAEDTSTPRRSSIRSTSNDSVEHSSVTPMDDEKEEDTGKPRSSIRRTSNASVELSTVTPMDDQKTEDTSTPKSSISRTSNASEEPCTDTPVGGQTPEKSLIESNEISEDNPFNTLMDTSSSGSDRTGAAFKEDTAPINTSPTQPTSSIRRTSHASVEPCTDTPVGGQKDEILLIKSYEMSEDNPFNTLMDTSTSWGDRTGTTFKEDIAPVNTSPTQPKSSIRRTSHASMEPSTATPMGDQKADMSLIESNELSEDNPFKTFVNTRTSMSDRTGTAFKEDTAPINTSPAQPTSSIRRRSNANIEPSTVTPMGGQKAEMSLNESNELSDDNPFNSLVNTSTST